MVDTSVQVISWLVFSIEIIAILALCGLRFFAIFKDNENGNKGWFVELALALVFPAWISHFSTAEGIGMSIISGIVYSHFKMWIVVAPIQGVSLIFLAYANTKEKPLSTMFFVIFTSVAWAYCSWRGVELAASGNESSWAFMFFGLFIMTMPIIQFITDILRNVRNGIDNVWTRKYLVLFGIGCVSWVCFWIDWMIGAQGWNWSWYIGWPELFQAVIDLIATVIFGLALVLMPPASVLLPFNGVNDSY